MMLGDDDLTDLGMVNNLAIIKKPGSSKKLLVVGQSEQHDRWVRIITWGAAQTLWFHLTHILYPRAADQLTPRAATAMLSDPDSPTVTTSFAASYDEEKGVISVRGIGGQRPWVIRFPMHEGYELWASLEDILDAV